MNCQPPAYINLVQDKLYNGQILLKKRADQSNLSSIKLKFNLCCYVISFDTWQNISGKTS